MTIVRIFPSALAALLVLALALVACGPASQPDSPASQVSATQTDPDPSPTPEPTVETPKATPHPDTTRRCRSTTRS